MEGPWTERHSDLVADAAPSAPDATDAELTRTWNLILERTRPIPVSGRRRPVRIAVGVLAVAATLTIGGVATASVFTAHTGEYPVDAEDVRLGGPGELLNPVASDFGDTISEVIADIPFPSDVARASLRANLVADGERDSGSGEAVRASTGAVRAWAAQGAICGWADQWAAAIASGDTSARAQASDMLRDASTWPAVTAVDPQQKAHTTKVKARDVKTGEIITGTADDSTQFAFLKVVQAAAAGTSVQAMDEATSDLYCYGVSTPHLPVTNERNR